MESANLWTCNCIPFEYSLNQTPLKISSINPIPTLAPQKSITKPITCSIYPSPSQNPISSSKYPQNAQFLIQINPSSFKACLTTPHFLQNGPQILTEAPLLFRRTRPFLKSPFPCQNGPSPPKNDPEIHRMAPLHSKMALKFTKWPLSTPKWP